MIFGAEFQGSEIVDVEQGSMSDARKQKLLGAYKELARVVVDGVELRRATR